MTKLNDLLFDVKKVESENFFGLPANSDYSHAIIGNVENPDFFFKEDKILNVCSDRYELVPNAEIFPQIRQILVDKGIEFTESYNMINDSRFYADYVIEQQKIKIGDNDFIAPKISVQHSYNGLTKYSIVFGWFRFICSNGLVIPVEEKAGQNLQITGKHTKNIKNSFKKLSEHLNLFLDDQKICKELTVTYDKLTEQWVENWEDRTIEVMQVAKWSPFKAGKQKKDIVTPELSENTNAIFDVIRKESEILTGGKVNDWLVYNGINNVLHNDELNSTAPEIRMKTDERVLTALLS